MSKRKFDKANFKMSVLFRIGGRFGSIDRIRRRILARKRLERPGSIKNEARKRLERRPS